MNTGGAETGKWLLILFALAATPANAELALVGPGGFTTTHSREVAAAPDQVYSALANDISSWWDGAHSWSGDATNLYVDARANGCFCERLPGGGWIEHLRIVYLAPGREIRLQGGLGPLSEMGLHGTMTWRILPGATSGSSITFSYVVHGHPEGGFEQIAPAVDGVIGAQLDGLVRLLAGD